MLFMRSLLQSLLVAVAMIFCAGGYVGAKEEVDDADKNCLECHEDYYDDLKAKWEHKPFEDKECLECHQYHAFRNKRELNGPVIEVCTRCHTTIEEFDEESLHYPILDEMSCVTCHNPHASDDSKLFLTGATADLCGECHDLPQEGTNGYHRPYGEKQCLKCHNPHGSFFPGLLQLPAGYLCAECHPDILAGIEPSQMHSGNDLNSCEQCHVGHHSDHANLLKNEVTPLCTGCHEDLISGEEPKALHTVLEDEDCLICHLTHPAKGADHLTDTEPSLCFTCHSDIEEQLEKEVVHVAATDESCTACHDPHAGMLVSATQELCSACHDIEDSDFQATHKIDRPVESCRSCHDPHGSDHEGMFMEILHAPFEERDCESCHETGQSVEELRSNDLCLNCHDDPEPDGAHDEPAMDGRVCVDCHSPHAANRSGLLQVRIEVR